MGGRKKEDIVHVAFMIVDHVRLHLELEPIIKQ